jgi:hypothetical protein
MAQEDTTPRSNSPVGAERLTDRKPWGETVESSKPPEPVAKANEREDRAPHGHSGAGKGSETFGRTMAHLDRDKDSKASSNHHIWHGKKVLAPLAFALGLGLAGASWAAGMYEGFEPGGTNSTTGQANPVAPSPPTGKEFTVFDTRLARGAAPQSVGMSLTTIAADTWTVMQSTAGLTALAGGGLSGATQLKVGLNQVTTVATAADSVVLPTCIVGSIVLLTNAGANSMTVYAANSELINATAGATGIAQAAGVTNLYDCPATTHWYKM